MSVPPLPPDIEALLAMLGGGGAAPPMPGGMPPVDPMLDMMGAPPPMDPMGMMPPMPMPLPVQEEAPPEGTMSPDSVKEPALDGIYDAPQLQTPRTIKNAAKIKPYELRKARGGKAGHRPKASYILEELKRRKEHWAMRDRRMDMDASMYLLEDAVETPVEGESKYTRLTPRSTVDKLSYMIGRQKDKITVRPRAVGNKWEEAAQNIEDFLYNLREVANEKYQSKLNQSLGRDEAWYAACRGWVASRISLDIDALDAGEDMPLLIDLYDPRYCYPQMGRSGPGMCMNMIYAETTDVAGFLASNPWAADEEIIQDMETGDEIEWVWWDDEYYSIILVNETVIKSVKHDYGFCPWVVTIAGGAPLRDETARGQLGSGVLTPMRATIKQFDRLLSGLLTNFDRAGNPVKVVEYDSTKSGGKPPAPMSMTPGTENIQDAGKGQKYDVIQVVAPPMETQLLFDALNDDIKKQGLLPALWGDAESVASGFHQSVIQNAGEDALYPTVDCIIQHRQWQCKLALLVVLCADDKKLLENSTTDEDDGEETRGVTYTRKDRSPGRNAKYSKRTPKYSLGVLTPKDIETHGVGNIYVGLHRMTPQDMGMMVQTASQAVAAKLLSIDWIRENWLDIDDPVQMNLDVMYELIYSDEEMMREVFMPLALKSDPEVYSFYMNKEKERKQREMMQAQSGMMGGGPPQPPGVPPGLPNQMLPSPMQMDQGAPMDPIAAMMSGAQAGNPSLPI